MPCDLEPHAHVGDEKVTSEPSRNDPFWSILERRLSRRSVLHKSALATAAAALSASLVGCADHDEALGDGLHPLDWHPNTGSQGLGAAKALGFVAISKGLQDGVRVPVGYTARVLTALGDPICEDAAAYANDGTDGDFDKRIGDHGDALAYFALPKGSECATDGLLVQNHEALTDLYLHPSGPTRSPLLDKTATGPRPLAEVLKEQEAHGVSSVRIHRDSNGKWSVDRAWSGNRRWHANTEMKLSGPACGSRQMITKASPAARSCFGTLNNCGHGMTPWGTYLSGEENFASYFTRGDDAAVDAARDVKLARYGIAAKNVDPAMKVAPGNYRGWDRAEGGSDLQKRFDCTATASRAADDFRNEPNHFGYAVELDPYRPDAPAKKRTALGRMAHEGCWFGTWSPGRRSSCTWETTRATSTSSSSSRLPPGTRTIALLGSERRQVSRFRHALRSEVQRRRQR